MAEQSRSWSVFASTYLKALAAVALFGTVCLKLSFLRHASGRESALDVRHAWNRASIKQSSRHADDMVYKYLGKSFYEYNERITKKLDSDVSNRSYPGIT